MTVRAVVFDWGGTLTPWHDIDLYAQWYAYAVEYDPVNASALAHRLLANENARWSQQRDTAGACSAGALDQLFLDEGIDVNAARHLGALSAYLDFWAPHTQADPDAAPTLAALRGRGCRVGVLSNTMWPRAHHEEVFARDDLDELIDAAVYTSEIPVAKPHASAFTLVLDQLGVTASETVFVGDRLWDDIDGAQRVGMRAVWVPHSAIPTDQVPAGLDEVTPDAVAHRLLDVVTIVDGWR
jgi:putative hydrolase of the HAD superfamily